MGKEIKVPSNLIGSHNHPATVAAGGSAAATGILNMDSDWGAVIGVNISWSGSLTAGALIQYFWTPNDLDYFEDTTSVVGSPITGPTGACPAGGVNIRPYVPPKAAKSAKVVVTNKDTSVAISVLSLGCSIVAITVD